MKGTCSESSASNSVQIWMAMFKEMNDDNFTGIETTVGSEIYPYICV